MVLVLLHLTAASGKVDHSILVLCWSFLFCSKLVQVIYGRRAIFINIAGSECSSVFWGSPGLSLRSPAFLPLPAPVEFNTQEAWGRFTLLCWWYSDIQYLPLKKWQKLPSHLGHFWCVLKTSKTGCQILMKRKQKSWCSPQVPSANLPLLL